jgi:extracellular matrix regulatory protein A
VSESPGIFDIKNRKTKRGAGILETRLINVGFGNIISAGRVIAIVSPESAPIKRLIQEAKGKGTLIASTCGRRTRAIIVMDSGHIVLSALQPETIANRFVTEKDDHAEDKA